MKHKPPSPPTAASHAPVKEGSTNKLLSQAPTIPTIPEKPLKLILESGDMVLMRGRTQAHWLHSLPKRTGLEADKGRINITFRKALVRGGTENYYCYNVGNGGVWKWDVKRKEMRQF